MGLIQASSPEEYETIRQQAREAGVRAQPLGGYRLAVPGSWQPTLESTPEEPEVPAEVTETPPGAGTAEEVTTEAQEPAQPDVETVEPADVFDPASHTAKQVLEFVDDHPEQLASVLEAEKAGQARVTLTRELETRLEGNGGS